jgi:acyl-homoserine lactone acylase PvdQ
LDYKEDVEMKSKTFPVYRTHHGPITHLVDGKWTATAMMWEPVKALEQSYTRTKKKNHSEFWEMMRLKTNSSNNTVFADSEGNIAYYHGNFIPRRDTTFNYRQPVDGSNPATDWQGLHRVEEAITVVNPANGWIQNCNSTPFTSAAEYSPKRENYPNYMTLDREMFRAVNATRLLSEVKELTLDGLIDLAYDPYLPAFEYLIPGLIEAYDRSQPKNEKLKTPIDALRNWDFTVSKESSAMSLANFYGFNYLRKGERPDGVFEIDAIKFFGTASPDEERLAIFEEVVDQLEADFGTWDTPWGEINRFQRLNGDIRQDFDDDKPSIPVAMTSARWGALAAYGARRGSDTKRIYGTRGNSFVAAVEFGDKVKAKTLLAGGQSNDPNSPHFDDQMQRYADATFKEVPFYREDVEARAEENYQPGKRK